jgi:hypothetical protein
MKKLFILLTLICYNLYLFAQPSFFSWKKPGTGPNKGNNYISPAKNQGEQGPCFIFASVATVEAMCHIYYNKPYTSSNGIDLAEAEIYSWCSGYGCTSGVANNVATFNYIADNGIINEDCFTYPDNSPFCRSDCENICSNPDYEVSIPGYQELNLSSNQELKRAIIDYGPITATLDKCGYELHEDVNDNMHSFLIIGWNSSGEWHIKDSWPNDYWIDYKSINVFNPVFDGKFYRVIYENEGSTISCSGSGCSTVFSSRSYVDNDEDGFYNWGIGDKPSGCSVPCLMDFNDEDPTKIFLDANYNELPAPTLSGPVYTCS